MSLVQYFPFIQHCLEILQWQLANTNKEDPVTMTQNTQKKYIYIYQKTRKTEPTPYKQTHQPTIGKKKKGKALGPPSNGKETFLLLTAKFVHLLLHLSTLFLSLSFVPFLLHVYYFARYI